ncbi:MAG: hypothetical protein IH984_12550 [Planctomycetes bacterium]|nr:hypothetical protein [Planctomycetota bacterium]
MISNTFEHTKQLVKNSYVITWLLLAMEICKRVSCTLALCLVSLLVLSCTSDSQYQNPTALQPLVAEWIKSPANNQTMKVEYPAVYDTFHQRIIAFGGRAGNWDGVSETWAYDFKADTWTNMLPPTGPPWRASHAMVYDPDRGKILLFGGDDFTKAFNDLWEYDYGLNTWTELTPANPPDARQMHNIVYDEKNEVMLLFGGRRAGGGAGFSDTWEYDHKTNRWRLLNPPQSPPIRDHVNLVYDIQHQKTILYCGPISHNISEISTWAYDYGTNTWSKLSLEQSPSGDHSGLVYNRNAGTTTYFGNSEITDSLEVWVFDYGSMVWIQASSAILPLYKEHFGMAYDSDHNTYLITGGFPDHKNWILKITTGSN